MMIRYIYKKYNIMKLESSSLLNSQLKCVMKQCLSIILYKVSSVVRLLVGTYLHSDCNNVLFKPVDKTLGLHSDQYSVGWFSKKRLRN